MTNWISRAQLSGIKVMPPGWELAQIHPGTETSLFLRYLHSRPGIYDYRTNMPLVHRLFGGWTQTNVIEHGEYKRASGATTTIEHFIDWCWIVAQTKTLLLSHQSPLEDKNRPWRICRGIRDSLRGLQHSVVIADNVLCHGARRSISETTNAAYALMCLSDKYPVFVVDNI